MVSATMVGSRTTALREPIGLDLPWRASGERIVRLLRRRSPGCALRRAYEIASDRAARAVVAEPRDLHRLAIDHPVGGLQATAPSKQDSDLTASGRCDTPDLGGRTYR